MEGTRPSGRWKIKASFCTTLLLMGMFIPTFASKALSVKKNCTSDEYENEKGICCNKCPAGYRLSSECEAEHHRSTCKECPDGEYMENMNYYPQCSACRRCKEIRNEVTESKCRKDKNAVCGCKDGYYKHIIDSETFECKKCKQCKPDEDEKQKCTSKSNTECGCKVHYYKLKNKCVPCKNCTSNCEDFCTKVDVTKGPKIESGYLTNIIAVAVTVAMVSLVVASLITYMTTKCLTKKKLQERASQQSDVSPESLEVLVQNDETPDKGLKAIPQSSVSEQEPFNLPDCVPLEIKIPDLIYTVLDLVPVLQVKQLVRSLGVTDTEIERAEMDHRACQEAHYQILRAWAQRGSRAGAGGRGGMLHRPLMLELLDKLREMHLGRAAEELETKYGIQ